MYHLAVESVQNKPEQSNYISKPIKCSPGASIFKDILACIILWRYCTFKIFISSLSTTTLYNDLECQECAFDITLVRIKHSSSGWLFKCLSEVVKSFTHQRQTAGSVRSPSCSMNSWKIKNKYIACGRERVWAKDKLERGTENSLWTIFAKQFEVFFTDANSGFIWWF